MISITIDTNLINTKNKLPEVNILENYYTNGLIKIVATDRLLQETENDHKRYLKANLYDNISEPFTVGYSRIGYAYISSGERKPSFEELAKILFPRIKPINLTKNQSNDVMHLVSHVHSDSDYFVTNNIWDFIHEKRTNENRNKNYLDKKRIRLHMIGIEICTPKEMIDKLNDIINFKKQTAVTRK